MKTPKSKAKPIAKPRSPRGFARSLITPEGIDLRLTLASGGARVGAFLIDLGIMVISLIALTYALIFGLGVLGTEGIEIAIIVWILVFFFLRNFYFMFFEMGPKGATPGKRLVKTRVASRSGGHLTASAVFARNAMREIEFFLPLSLVFGPKDAGVDGVMTLLGIIWSFIFLLFPLFNKDRLRAGDLIAGTWVVNAPRMRLSKDLADNAPDTSKDRAASLPRYSFSNTQLDAYGVKELHVLETVLRKNNPPTLSDVSERIANKIKWQGADTLKDNTPMQREFLKAYYGALRGKLETKLLFGVRRKDKFDKS